MPPDLLSDAELVRPTSRLVAAHCRSQAMDVSELPGLIASVSRSLRSRHAPLAQNASALPPKSRARSKAGHPVGKRRKAIAAPKNPPTFPCLNVVYLTDYFR